MEVFCSLKVIIFMDRSFSFMEDIIIYVNFSLKN